MTELNASSLSQLPPKVAAPPYDRSRLKRGIARFGVGNFIVGIKPWRRRAGLGEHGARAMLQGVLDATAS